MLGARSFYAKVPFTNLLNGRLPFPIDDAVVEVELPEGGEPAHQNAAQAQQQRRDRHESARSEAVVQTTDNHAENSHAEKGRDEAPAMAALDQPSSSISALRKMPKEI